MTVVRGSAAAVRGPRQVTEREWAADLDRRARLLMGMSGEQFVARWLAGEFRDRADDPNVIRVSMLIPVGRKTA